MHIQRGTVSDAWAGGKDLGGCRETGKTACRKKGDGMSFGRWKQRQTKRQWWIKGEKHS